MSVARRTGAALQETVSGRNLEAPDSQNPQNENTFHQLRNSKSYSKGKMSATGKKSKKMKKSESQARHQQLTKSELMTQPNNYDMGDTNPLEQLSPLSKGQGLNSINSGNNSALLK